MARGYRFLLTPRWLGLIALALILCGVFVQLGMWQLHRLDERKARNAVINGNLDRPTVPVGAVLATGRPASSSVQWRTVTASGRYDQERTILLRNRTNDGVRGFDVLVPLVLGNGSALIVDRGWIPAGASAKSRVDIPAPPEGEVTVTGWVRPGQSGRPALTAATTETAQPSVARVDPGRLARTLPYPLYGAYVGLIEENPPAPGDQPVSASAPQVWQGPHLAYAIQWFLFCGIAVGGLVVLARQEQRETSARAAGPAGQSPERAGYGGPPPSASDLA